MGSNLKRPEEMAAFFDSRVEEYEDHMRQNITSFERFYHSIQGTVDRTGALVDILDLGCGTALQLEGIFTKAPNAKVVAIDMSQKMLARLREKYSARLGQIETVQGSYLDLPFGENRFDYVVSVQTMHHLLQDIKRTLYARIRRALKPGGKYIEGDYIVTPEEEEQKLAEYYEKLRWVGTSAEGLYHIDIPFSVQTQRKLLAEAGFIKVDVIHHEDSAAVFVAIPGPSRDARFP